MNIFSTGSWWFVVNFNWTYFYFYFSFSKFSSYLKKWYSFCAWWKFLLVKQLLWY